MKHIENLRYLYLAFVITMTQDTFEEQYLMELRFPFTYKNVKNRYIYIYRLLCMSPILVEYNSKYV